MAGKKRRRSENNRIFLSNLPELIKAAEAGDPDAQHDLAAFYATDDFAGLKNEAEAVRWYARAAACGYAPSQYDLGFMLCLGEGTGKDVAKGLWWLEQAAGNGETYAARLLSDVYAKGMFGVEPDPERAASWNERAGEFKDRL